MIVRIVTLTFILLIGCNQKSEKTNHDYEKTSEPLRVIEKSTSKSLKKTSASKVKESFRAPSIIQPKDKVYKSLQNLGITFDNLDFFFHSDLNFRKLMLEKLLNTRNPYHLHLVWQRLKQMLDNDQWKVGFNQTLTTLWQNSDESLRDQILNYLLIKPKLLKVGRTPWTASTWLLTLKIPSKSELPLLKALKNNQHPSRQWVRNYLSKRYGKNFGSNYLIWKQFLKQN